MTYQATVVRIKTAPHPNADNLQLGLCMGTTVVIGKNVLDGDLMLFFPTDGQLSEEFAKANDLIARKDENGNRAGGFFSENRRVRSQKFRGQKSDGFCCELRMLEFAGDIRDLKEGDSFDTFNGIPICNKYFTPATIKQMNAIKSGQQRKAFPSFPKHIETEQFYKCADLIPVNSTIWITEKLHGTSFRVGNVWVDEELPRKWYHKLLGLHPRKVGYDIVNGTRNTVLGKTDKTYYHNEDFRIEATAPWQDRLHEGEIVYGEIVGYTTTGQPIMHPASLKDLKDKELTKKYGDLMHYSYGCKPDGLYCDLMKPQHDVYVYRIVRTDSKGNTVEYSWPQVKARCQELGIKHVPELWEDFPLVYGGKEHESIRDLTLEMIVDSRLEGSSLLDQTHLREGVVLRVEPPVGKPYWLKAKSFSFKLCEGMIKEDENAVDLEEIS